MSGPLTLSPSSRVLRRAMVVVALAGVVFLALRLVDLDGESDRAVDRDRESATARDLRTESPGPGGATLEGHARTTEAPVRVDVRLCVVGRFGQPLPDYPVRVTRADGEEDRLSDDRGEVLVADVPLDGSVAVRARLPGNVQAPHAGPALRLRRTEETLRVVAGTLLELDLRDAETGEPIEGGRWRYVQRLLQHTSPWHTGAERTVLPFVPGGRVLLHLEVEPPEGRVSWDTRRFWIPMDVSARIVRIVHPLRPEARIVVDATETTDGSVASPVLLGFEVPGRQTQWTWGPADARGWIRARHVPYLRGSPFRVVVGDLAFSTTYDDSPDFEEPDPASPEERSRSPRLQGVVILEGRMGDRASDEVLVREVVPPVAERPLGPVPGHSDVDTTGWQPGPGEPSFWSDPEAWAEGDVEILVLDRDGRPIARAQVTGHGGRPYWRYHGRTDEDGRVHLSGCAAGRGFALLADPRHLPATVRFEVRPNDTARVTLREPEGGRLVLRVVDDEGVGLPYATVSLQRLASEHGEAHPYPRIRWEGDVLVVDVHTDHRGRFGPRRLEAGTWEVTARGTAAERTASHGPLPVRQATARVEIRDGRTTVEELVLTAKTR